MKDRIYRAIDASINRAVEGIRVCEDIFRFVVNGKEISGKLKELRHRIVELTKEFPQNDLLNGRDVVSDSVKFLDVNSEKTRGSVIEIAKSNIHRSMEAMRSIEEFTKLMLPESMGNPFQEIRFSLYSLEKDMISILTRGDKREKFISSLYAILDSTFVKNNEYNSAAKQMIAGGASIIQLRMKNQSQKFILEKARELASICRDNNVLFIVNDYPDIAYLAEADGVHLGQDDISVEDARKILPLDMIIGVSTHSFKQALVAVESEPDYVAVGPVFDTKSKNDELINGIGTDAVREIAEKITIPIVAIGGLDPGKMPELENTKCRCFALISFLYKDGKIKENCREITSLL